MYYSNDSNGYHAGYIKDDFGCIKRPCECAGFTVKDKTIIGMDLNRARHKISDLLSSKNTMFIHGEGDIMLTPRTAHRLIPFRTLQNDKFSAAFTTNETFWTENKINGYYIIGYIINDKLDSLNKKIIPEVRHIIALRYPIKYLPNTKSHDVKALSW